MENLKRKRQLSPGTIQRHFEALQIIEEKTKDKFVTLKLQEFISSFGINNKIGSILISKGILKQAKSTENPRSIAYKWNTIKPTLQMAKAIIDENRRIEIEKGQKLPKEKRLNFDGVSKEYISKMDESREKDFSFEQVEKNPVLPFIEGNRITAPEVKKEATKTQTSFKRIKVKTKPQKSEEQKEISLFWGLFKYKSNK